MLTRCQGRRRVAGGVPAAGRAPARAAAQSDQGRGRRGLRRRSGVSLSFRPMTVAIPFDTHRFVKNLMRNGFSRQQAEVLAEEQAALLNANLATKADIEKIRAEIHKARWSTVRWMFGAMIGLAGLIIALR